MNWSQDEPGRWQKPFLRANWWLIRVNTGGTSYTFLHTPHLHSPFPHPHLLVCFSNNPLLETDKHCSACQSPCTQANTPVKHHTSRRQFTSLPWLITLPPTSSPCDGKSQSTLNRFVIDYDLVIKRGGKVGGGGCNTLLHPTKHGYFGSTHSDFIHSSTL